MTPSSTQPPRELDEAWSYAANPGFYDEFLSLHGKVRDHVGQLAGALAAMGHAGLEQRWQQGRRLIHENGVTYNVYGDPESAMRPWPLDPLPLTIATEEWKGIEVAIVQRAVLFNTILADLYGPQRLLREKTIPVELVFPNPAFLRPCVGIHPPGGRFLHVYAADLARSPDGQWWVISDRTQTPSGAGYALENRLVTTRVLPDVFRASHVRRLAHYFQTYRDTLQHMVPAHRENPRIVLLTPGPYNETYFEHAFLARYLGFTLVEGGDLTVRDNRVFLKTLGGLLPVDVIVRRQDDHYCDPLELRPDSMLGVPGLVQAVRAGNVAVVNALGSGLAESPAYAAFLPGICRALLGEELKMPSIATWWCGQKEPLEYVSGHLDRLVVKAAFPGARAAPIFGASLGAKERQKLLARVKAEPDQYVAQEHVALSTVPVWENGTLQPRHLVMRVFAVASDEGYSVMPGGLTRVSKSIDTMVVSMQSGGGSKDTWVLGNGPAPAFTLLRQTGHPLDISRATFDLPSRVSDNLFWLGRYTERLEMTVRLCQAILARFFQESDAARAAGLNAAMSVLTALGYVAKDAHAAAESTILPLIYDPKATNGLVGSVHQVRRIAWLLRDRISANAWLVLNQMDQEFSEQPPVAAMRIGDAQDRLNSAVTSLSAFAGLVMETMTRGDGWRFLDIGRRIERARQLAEMLRVAIPGGEGLQDAGVLEVILEIACSTITYRSRYHTSLQTDLVLDLLVVDEANPRSIAFQLARLSEHVDRLPGTLQTIRRPVESRIVLALLTAVQLADVRELARTDSQPATAARRALLTRVMEDLENLSDTLSRAYFSLAARSRQL